MFAQKYLDEFIKQSLENEIIPDILIDTLKSLDVDRSFYEHYRYPTYIEEPPKTYVQHFVAFEDSKSLLVCSCA